MLNSACAALLAVLHLTMGVSDSTVPFTEEFVKTQYDALAPALCVISYSVEITNASTGVVNRQDKRALGLIVTADGLVMAYGHMRLENAEPLNIRVTIGRGDQEKEFEATLLEKPDNLNICLVRITHDGEPLNLPHAPFAADVRLDVGDPILVFGIMGEQLDFAPTVFVRRVGAVLDTPRTTYCIDDRVPFGCVSGPVVDGRGRVVGVVGLDLAPNEGGELYVRYGHPLVYQSPLFRKYIETPPSEDTVTDRDETAWLGVLTQPLTDDLAEYWGLPKKGGVVISAIVPESPGETAGFRRGDIVVSFNGTPVRARHDNDVLTFTKLVREAGIDSEVPVQFLRDGEPQELTVKLERRPVSAQEAEEYQDPVFGLTVRQITTDVRILLNLGEEVQGVIVRRVKSGSWADLAGFRPGVIILRFGEYEVTNLAQFEEAVKKIAEDEPTEITVFCRVGPQTGFFRIQPRWEAPDTDPGN